MSAFVCREDALAAVAGVLRRPPALVLVEGEAGIGKTRLVQECVGSLPDRAVLTVVCPPLDEPLSLGPVVEGLRHLWGESGPAGLSPLAGALRPLFPEWDDDLPPPLEPLEDAGATRSRLFRALADLTDRLGVEVLVFEDAHWADTASLEWLLTVTGGSQDGRRSVVVTYRPQDVPPGSLLWRLTSRPRSGAAQLRVELEPLDVAGVQQLTRSMFGIQDVSDEFATFLHERTGGLPLAVEQCLRLLRDRGDITRKADQWARRELGQLRVPPTVRDSVLERVDRLDPAARRVLETAAVLADPEQEARLAAVAGLAPEAARTAVMAGLRSGLLGEPEPGRVGFRHRLAAEAVQEAIPATERRRLHRRAGQVLQAAGEPSVARLSRHFKEAGDHETWTRYAEASADLALETGDDQAAVTLLQELLTTVEHPGERRARLARKLGEAAASGAAGLSDRAGQVMETLREVIAGGIPADQRGRIRLLLGRLLRWYGREEAASREIEAAIPDLEDQPGLACRAMMTLGSALSHDWPVQRHLEWIERATAQLPHVEPPAERLNAAVVRASALLALGEEAGWEAAGQLPKAAANPLEQRMVLHGMLDAGQLAITWGRYAEARSRLVEAIQAIEAAGYQRVLNIAHVACVVLDWHTGAWAGLRETAAQLAESAQTEPDVIRVDARLVQALVELAGGARAEAEQRLCAVLRSYAGCASLDSESGTAAAAVGRIHLAEGAAREAYEFTEPVMATITRKQVWLWATDVAPVHLDALVGLGELERAEDLAQRFADWCADRDAPAPAAASLLCTAIVAQGRGELNLARDLYPRAARAWAALPRPYDELLTRERLGRCLLLADEPDEGIAVLSEVRGRLQDLGARWDADRVAHLLRQRGVEVPRPWRSGPRGYGDQLSPREREVVALVAQGMTNREVGRRLFLSPKTVGCHLGNAMRKLGVTSRTMAAMAVAEAGLVPSTPEEPVGSSANG